MQVGSTVGHRADDALREVNLAMLLRPDEASVLYNAACAYCRLGKKTEALDVLAKAHAAGFGDADWARRDPDLAILHGEPEFERLYPAGRGADAASTWKEERTCVIS